MELDKLLKKTYLAKQHPDLAAPTSEEIVEALLQVLLVAKSLSDAVASGRLKGAPGTPGKPGKDARPLVPDRDYPSISTTEGMVARQVALLAAQLKRDLDTVRQEANLSPERMAEIAAQANALVELPDFAALLTSEPQAIRDGLELLQGDDRLSIEAVRDLSDVLEDIRREAQSRITSFGATIARYLGQIGDVNTEGATTGQVLTRRSDGSYNFQTPASGGGSLTINQVSGTINGSNTAFTIAEGFTGMSWIRLGTTVLLEDVDYSVSGTDIIYNSAPPAGLSGKPHHLVCVS